MIVNDVTCLNPVKVDCVVYPSSAQDISLIFHKARSDGASVSVAGGRFSMGGQTASPGSVNMDMAKMNRILDINLERNLITVEAGCRWSDLQKILDPLGKSVLIMQTYNNFTVGGSLSVNCHGRYIGHGPIVSSVMKIKAVLANGDVVTASRDENSEAFHACIGGYGAIGVIVEATLLITENVTVKESMKQMSLTEYFSSFTDDIGNNSAVVFHNADIHLDNYASVTSVNWTETNEKPEKTGLSGKSRPSLLYRYLAWAYSSRFGHFRRRIFHEPVFYWKSRVRTRNAEASYDVRELASDDRRRKTYVLQEYFIPAANAMEFIKVMGSIFLTHKVQVLNVSIRHARKDGMTYLSWANEDVFCFVVYYRENPGTKEQSTVPIWTRQLIDAAISSGGRYYLPYQPHATYEQFCAAYPDADKLFRMKMKIDPGFILKNSLWNKYYPRFLESFNQAGQTPTQT